MAELGAEPGQFYPIVRTLPSGDGASVPYRHISQNTEVV